MFSLKMVDGKNVAAFFFFMKDRCYCSDYNTDFLKCESLCIINFPFPDSSLSMEPIKGILQIIHFNSLQQTKMKSATYFTSVQIVILLTTYTEKALQLLQRKKGCDRV